MNTLRTIVMKLAILGGILGAGAVMATAPAFAATASATTRLTLTIPASLTMTGPGATYASNGIAGQVSNFHTGGITISTNSLLGYNMTVKAQTATFAGTGANVQSIPVANDSVVVPGACPTGATCAAASALSNVTALQVINRTTATPAGGDSFFVDQNVTVPSTLVADSYSINVDYVATSN